VSIPNIDLSKRPKRHSYSAIARYKECPARYAYGYIMKLPDPPSAAMARGTRLHGLAESYMLDKKREVPVHFELRKIGLELFRMRELGAIAEQTWMVNKDWEPTDDPEKAHVKAIIDVHYLTEDGGVLHCHDYKSGRAYPSHSDQLELYSILGLLRYPNAHRAESGAIYIDSGTTGADGSILRQMLPTLVRRWDADIGRMEDDVEFVPTPGSHCKWCAYASRTGGPCQGDRGAQ
jgi:hypothetical protein